MDDGHNAKTAQSNERETAGQVAKTSANNSTRKAVIALGANVGKTEATIKMAIRKIGLLPGVMVVATSRYYYSRPAHYSNQPDFTNVVILATLDDTVLSKTLLYALQDIETSLGRDRSAGVPVNGPRRIDIDVIDIQGVVSEDPELLLPHPLAFDRDFVMRPLLEIAPDYVFASGERAVEFIWASADRNEYPDIVGANAAAKEVLDSAGASEQSDSSRIKERKNTDKKRGQADIKRAEADVGAGGEGEPADIKLEAGERKHEAKGGILYICATPIGNLGDITLRVIEALGKADVVYAEDTRVARRLLSHLNLRPTLRRCDENVIRGQARAIAAEVLAGRNVAYVTDAGTPGICDPGAHLIGVAREVGARVEVLPGASALLVAIAASGFNASSFFFGGFLPRKRTQLQKLLESLRTLPALLAFFESPHRIEASLQAIAELVPNRKVALCRELTKLHEEVIVATAAELAAEANSRGVRGEPLKGEIVVVLDLPPEKPARVHKDKFARGFCELHAGDVSIPNK